ncbi:MAG: hypothetical protein LBS21_08580, partial [Clostridiales bacterium]|nr:hypothetical protein [Clostridiales bacterium]
NPCRIATRRTGKDNGLPFRMMTKKCHHSGKRIAPPYYSKVKTIVQMMLPTIYICTLPKTLA